MRSWRFNKRQLYTNINNEARPSSTGDVGSENYFYWIRGITLAEKRILERENSTLQSVAIRSLIQSIINACYLFELEVAVATDEEDIKKLEIRQANMIEESYCIIEDLVLPAHQKLLGNDRSNFTLDDYQNTVRFITFQLARTRKARDNTAASTADLAERLKKEGINVDNYQKISSLIFAEKICLVTIEKLYKIYILENCSTVNLITNDNPVTVIETDEPTNPSFYWPLSPKRAILLEKPKLSETESKEIKRAILADPTDASVLLGGVRNIGLVEVNELNEKIWKGKQHSIYGIAANDITKFLTDQIDNSKKDQL